MSYEEQIMSKDKYPSIFLPQMEAIVFIILQIFFATRAIFKIGEYSRIFHSLGYSTFRPITREPKDLMDYKSHYTMIYKNFERMRDFFGLFIFIVVYFARFWGPF